MCSSPKIIKAYGSERSESEKSKVGLTEMEIQEWNMELRTNNVCLDEHTSDVMMEKIKELEKWDAQKRHDRDRINQERAMVSQERHRTNTEKERTYTSREQANEQRENANKLRESANVEREGRNNDRESANV